MNRLPLYTFIAVLLLGLYLLISGHFSNRQDQIQPLDDQETVFTEDPIVVPEVSDFASGTAYLFFDGNTQKEATYLGSEEDELGTRAVFRMEEGQEFSFYPTVLFTIPEEKDVKEVTSWVKNNEDIVDYNFFNTLNMYAITFSSPYEAYLEYLKLSEDERMIGVGLDMKVTITNDEAGVEIGS